MLTTKRSLTLLLVLGLILPSAFAFLRSQTSTATEWGVSRGELSHQMFDQYHQLVFFAVLEGLHVDGVSNEVVDSLTGRQEEETVADLFIPGCPICQPALHAFLLYRERPKFARLKGDSNTFGSGLDPLERAQALSPDRLVRHETLNEMVKRWVERRLDNMRLTEAERTLIQSEFGKRRKEGMKFLSLAPKDSEGNLEFETCALCDAAAEAEPGR